MSPVCCNVLVKWMRLVCLVIFFAVVLASLPAHLKHDSANAQGSGQQLIQGTPSRNLSYFNDARGVEPGTPKVIPKEYGRSGLSLVPAQSGSSGILALGKPASQSSTGSVGDASWAVDGNTNGNF